MIPTVVAFKVEPGAVTALGGLVLRQSQGAATYVKALEHNEASEIGDGIFDIIENQLRYLRYYAQENSRRALSLADTSSRALVRTAEFYLANDQAQAAKLDRTYPAAAATPKTADELPAGVASDGFTDVKDVSGYQGPGEVDLENDIKWPDLLERKLAQLGDLSSNAARLAKYVEGLVGWNPIEKVSQVIAGDWNAIYRESRVMADAAKGFEAITANVQRGRFAIQHRWEGNAAAGAENWLDEYARACAEHAAYCREAAEKVSQLAQAAYHRYHSLEMALGCLIDTLTELVLAKQLNSIGAHIDDAIDLVFGGGPLKKLIKTVKTLAGEITTYTDVLWALAHEFVGIVQLARSQGEVVAARWPCAPYDHPGVR